MKHTCPHCGGEFAEAVLSERGDNKSERIIAAYCAANDYINALLNQDVPEESRAKIAADYWQKVRAV